MLNCFKTPYGHISAKVTFLLSTKVSWQLVVHQDLYPASEMQPPKSTSLWNKRACEKLFWYATVVYKGILVELSSKICFRFTRDGLNNFNKPSLCIPDIWLNSFESPLYMESDNWGFDSGIPVAPVVLFCLVEGVHSEENLKEKAELAHRVRAFCWKMMLSINLHLTLKKAQVNIRMKIELLSENLSWIFPEKEKWFLLWHHVFSLHWLELLLLQTDHRS